MSGDRPEGPQENTADESGSDAEATGMETDRERADRHERERLDAHERHERERKEAHERHERERREEQDRQEREDGNG